jgi:hypothetical protein
MDVVAEVWCVTNEGNEPAEDEGVTLVIFATFMSSRSSIGILYTGHYLYFRSEAASVENQHMSYHLTSTSHRQHACEHH